MTSCDAHDASVDALDLITLTPNPARAERVRARCRAQLERRQRREARTTRTTGFASRVLAPAVVGAVCIFYVAAIVATTLRLEVIFN
jgi:hypothetical protein